MARFCTKCGTALDPGARFCDGCGAPVAGAPAGAAAGPAAGAAVGAAVGAFAAAGPQAAAAMSPSQLPAASAPVADGAARPSASSVATGSSARPALSRRTLSLIGIGGAVVIVGGALLAYVLAPESASQASFARAVGQYLAANPDRIDRYVCTGNLPYRTNPIRVAEYDRGTREWMDMLAGAGVYAAPTMESSGGFMPQTQFVYRLTDAGSASIRNGKLCAAAGVDATGVTGFESVNRASVPPSALAHATLALRGEAPWLAKSPHRAELLHRLGMDAMTLDVPLALKDKKWQVSDRPVASGAAAGPGGLFGMGAGNPLADSTARAGHAAAPVAEPGLFARLRAMLPGGGPSLIGKWTDQSGMVQMEFTADSLITNGLSQPVSYRTEGNRVTVSPAQGGPGMVLTVSDADHASFDAGVMTLRLTRVK